MSDYSGEIINQGASVEYSIVNTATQTQQLQVNNNTASAFIKDILFSNVADFSSLVTPSGGTISISHSPNNKNYYPFSNGTNIPATSQAVLTAECSAAGDINYIQVVTSGVTGATYVKVIVDGLFSFSGKGGSSGASSVTVTNFPTNPGGTVVGQSKVAVANTAVQLPSNTLVNGVVVKASASNTGTIFVGGSGVTTTDDGTGNGYKLAAGEAISFAVTNSNAVYINSSTVGSFVYFSGN